MNTIQKLSVAALVLMATGVATAVWLAADSDVKVVRSYFDNGMDVPVKIDLDGKPALEVPAHSAKVYESLAVGKHQVKVTEASGKAVEDTTIEVPATKGLAMHRWAYNVNKVNHYKVRYLAYGNAKADPPKDLPDAQWFELPTTDAVFLPAEPAAEKRKGAIALATVGHNLVHKDDPCCANLRALIKK